MCLDSDCVGNILELYITLSVYRYFLVKCNNTICHSTVAHLELLLAKVDDIARVTTENNIKLTRANLRLDAVESRLDNFSLPCINCQQPGVTENSSASTSNCSSNDNKFNSSCGEYDQRVVSHDKGASALGMMIPCNSRHDVESLDSCLSRGSSRDWMVRTLCFVT